MVNALPLPLLTTAVLTNYVPKSIANICEEVAKTSEKIHRI
jgi:hypothetical protein